MEQFYDKVSASAAYIRAHIPQTPTVGIILGSGLGGLVDAMTDKTVIPYGDIPTSPAPPWRATRAIWSSGGWAVRWRRRFRGGFTTTRASA